MPVNRNALIRYKTIDKCLKNRRRKWTLEDLIEKVSDALYEYEGISKGISQRTIQADIQMMRSDKLGYNAPIIIVNKKYYTYEDADYSITNLPLTETDFNRMSEAVEVLKQFKGFSHFRDLGDVVQKLEGHMYASANKQRVVIDFEKNDQLKGLEHLSPIYEAITNEHALDISYQSFKARQPDTFTIHPWWLKEFKNRWFVIGVKAGQEQNILTFALDRIEKTEVNKKEKYLPVSKDVHPEQFYEHVIGVTVSSTNRPERVLILVQHRHAPYVLTKPLHHTQKLVERTKAGVLIEICVQHNFELEKEILSFGETMEVIEPAKLRNNIRKRQAAALRQYEKGE